MDRIKSLDNKDLEITKRYLQSIDIPIEILDIQNIMVNGAEKHGKDTWREPLNYSLQLNNNYASIGRHLAKWVCGINLDIESGEHHLLHVITRCLMAYTRETQNESKTTRTED